MSKESLPTLPAPSHHQGKGYIAAFHREGLDELRVRLETETWQRSPVQPNCDLAELKELAPSKPGPCLECSRIFLQCSHPSSTIAVTPSATAPITIASVPPPPPKYSYAVAWLDALAPKLETNASHIRSISEANAEIGADSAHDCADAMEIVSPTAAATDGDTEARGLFVCPTALCVCRFTARYLTLMRAMPALTIDALCALR